MYPRIEAAADIAAAIAGEGLRADRAFTGRCNLFAGAAGVLVVDKETIDRLNLRVDEAVTLATLAAFKPVVEGEMVATVKIIPFAIAAAARDQAVAEAVKASRSSRHTLQGAQGRRGLDFVTRSVAEGYREDAQNYCRPVSARSRHHRGGAQRTA